MDYRTFLAILQVYTHIFFIIGLFYFPLIVTIPALIIAQIIFVGACGTAFYHRTVAHKNSINPVVEKIMILVSWLGASGSAIAWAGLHRAHHRFSDTNKDPHNPLTRGKWNVYWFPTGDTNIIKYVPDLLRKKWYVFQHKYYLYGLILFHILGLLLLPIAAYWCVLVVPAVLMWSAGSSINIFCHDKTGPLNVPFLGYLQAGEGWHKNHHLDPANAIFNKKYDWGGYIHQFLRMGNYAR